MALHKRKQFFELVIDDESTYEGQLVHCTKNKNEWDFID